MPYVSSVQTSPPPASGLHTSGKLSGERQRMWLFVTSPRPSARMATRSAPVFTAYTTPPANTGLGATSPDRHFVREISSPVRGAYAMTHGSAAMTTCAFPPASITISVAHEPLTGRSTSQRVFPVAASRAIRRLLRSSGRPWSYGTSTMFRYMASEAAWP